MKERHCARLQHEINHRFIIPPQTRCNTQMPANTNTKTTGRGAQATPDTEIQAQTAPAQKPTVEPSVAVKPTATSATESRSGKKASAGVVADLQLLEDGLLRLSKDRKSVLSHKHSFELVDELRLAVDRLCRKTESN